MNRSKLQWLVVLSAISSAALCGTGCRSGAYYQYPTPKPLGTDVDNLNRVQEENAEAAKYVVYEHEFKLVEYRDGDHHGGYRLNEYGEDHIKRIAENLRRGADFPVVVERSQTSVKPGTEFEYPVHFNPELDHKRREVVVRSLVAMGIPDADQRVVIAPAFSQSLHSSEAEAAYYIGQQRFGGMGGMGGMGGFGMGGFGMGGFGGFGGGGFF